MNWPCATTLLGQGPTYIAYQDIQLFVAITSFNEEKNKYDCSSPKT
jgi:hypothetical protein